MPALIQELQLWIALNTYQTWRLVTIVGRDSELKLDYSQKPHEMGLTYGDYYGGTQPRAGLPYRARTAVRRQHRSEFRTKHVLANTLLVRISSHNWSRLRMMQRCKSITLEHDNQLKSTGDLRLELYSTVAPRLHQQAGTLRSLPPEWDEQKLKRQWACLSKGAVQWQSPKGQGWDQINEWMLKRYSATVWPWKKCHASPTAYPQRAPALASYSKGTLIARNLTSISAEAACRLSQVIETIANLPAFGYGLECREQQAAEGIFYISENRHFVDFHWKQD